MKKRIPLLVARPYSFVTMATEAAAQAAIEELNGQVQEDGGRPLTVQQFEFYSVFTCGPQRHLQVYLVRNLFPFPHS